MKYQRTEREKAQLEALVRSVNLFGTGFVYRPSGGARSTVLAPADVTVYLAADQVTETERLSAELAAGRELRDASGVTVARLEDRVRELEAQAEATWPPAPEEAESWCHRCHRPNVVWSAPSPLWNAVMRGGDINAADEFNGIICPTCFARLAEERGIAEFWRFDAQRICVELATTTPSGRMWDPVAWRWREPGSQPAADLAAENARLREERDLAIAHDRQPYPTAWAYEQACRVREKARAEVNAMRPVVEAAKAWREKCGRLIEKFALGASDTAEELSLIAEVDAYAEATLISAQSDEQGPELPEWERELLDEQEAAQGAARVYRHGCGRTHANPVCDCGTNAEWVTYMYASGCWKSVRITEETP